MIKFTSHVKIRMRERQVSQQQISKVLENSDQILRSFGKALVANKKFNKKTLEVVFLKKNKDFKIITCYWK